MSATKTTMRKHIKVGLDFHNGILISADEQYILYVHASTLFIRSIETWATFKIMKDIPEFNGGDSTVSPQLLIKLSDDNKTLAICNKLENSIRVVDLETERQSIIIQSIIEEIEDIEWLDNKHHNYLAVYSKHGINVNIYATHIPTIPKIKTIQKNISKVVRHPLFENHFSIVVTNNGVKNTFINFTIQDTEVAIMNTFEMKDNPSDVEFAISPFHSWIFAWNTYASNLSVYNFLGLGKGGDGFAFQKMSNYDGNIAPLGFDVLGFVSNKRTNEEFFMVGDLTTENLIAISMKSSLNVFKIWNHQQVINNTATVFERLSSNTQNQYINKSISRNSKMKLPLLNEDMPLFKKGIKFFKISSSSSSSSSSNTNNKKMFVTVTKSMPSVVFLWQWDSDVSSPSSPLAIINTQSPVESLIIGCSDNVSRTTTPYVNNVIDNLLVITNRDSITLYCLGAMSSPIVIDVQASSSQLPPHKIIGVRLLKVESINGEIVVKLCIWTQNDMMVINKSISATDDEEYVIEPDMGVQNPEQELEEDEEETDFNLLRLGTPIGLNATSDKMTTMTPFSVITNSNGDTFVNKANKKRKISQVNITTGKENDEMFI